ncbi:MLO-like protein 13 isoform X2 [Rhododendron vialii]|uniref:MLO-like protein 13 isoform X2 n=1 Tax=Rhododendron vialii TaxID=182163 RepID=UPI00265F6C79|nr:MLO-like protein 13 isoform X2 [Rhododendron vialii]
MVEESRSLEYTPTWVVAVVCFVIVLISLVAERGLHRLGKLLEHKDQDALFRALEKLKEELMLLGFISLLLNVSQGLIKHICIPSHLANYMLPCKWETSASEMHHEHHFQPTMTNGRRLLTTDTGLEDCKLKGKVPLLSIEGLHQLHIFIFVLALVHVIFCATTMVLGGARIRQWKHWEDSIRNEITKAHIHTHHIHLFKQRATTGHWRKSVVGSWMMSFFKQFYGSITKADYIALRSGFIRAHCPTSPNFNFHKYMVRTLEVDFKRIVAISWYLWLFVFIFLLLNIQGWNTFFWLSFLPLILLLLVGAKLENIITRLAQEAVETKTDGQEAPPVKPSDELFWFGKPRLVIYLIHFILFQNSFEIAFFIWIWSTYGFHSCIMEKLGFIIPRLFMGVLVQVLCSYSTLPLYALVTQMGSMFKQGIFEKDVQEGLDKWVGDRWKRGTQHHSPQIKRMAKESFEDDRIVEETPAVDEGNTTSIIELSPRT